MIQVDIQVILVIEKNTEIFVLGNIYASNFSTQNKSLFLNFEDQIEKTVEVYSNAKLVVGGDFNTIWDSEKDCLPPRPNNRSVLPELNHLCSTFDLIDIWRHKYPEQIQFTLCKKKISSVTNRLLVNFKEFIELC